MTKLVMMKLVDRICEEEGYEDGPAYDLLYSECCQGRHDDEVEKMIKEKLKEYNA
jgi:hypothetical protein